MLFNLIVVFKLWICVNKIMPTRYELQNEKYSIVLTGFLDSLSVSTKNEDSALRIINGALSCIDHLSPTIVKRGDLGSFSREIIFSMDATIKLTSNINKVMSPV